MDKKYLSYTQLAMFMRCPKQYEYRYMKGLKIPPSGAMVQSRVWHQTLENNYRQKIASEADLPLSDMEDYFVTRYDEVFGNEEVIIEKGDNLGSLKDQGVSIVAVHHEVIAPKVRPAIVEEKFRISLGDDFPFDLLGIWDLIETDGTIVDNKAYKKTPNQNDLDKDLQFSLYSLGYRASKKQVERALRIDAIVKNKTLKAVQLTTTRTNEECRWLLGLIEKVAEAIVSGVFYPNPNGWHCNQRFCGYWNKCKRS